MYMSAMSKDEKNLTDKTLDYINKKAMEGTIQAHVEGNVPNILINIENLWMNILITFNSITHNKYIRKMR